MRNGEGFLLVFSVIDRSRFVSAEFFLVPLSLTTKLYWCASFINFYSSHIYKTILTTLDTFFMDLSLILTNKLLVYIDYILHNINIDQTRCLSTFPNTNKRVKLDT